MKETPAAHLMKARKRAGLSKETVARRLEISTRHYYDIEAGLVTPSLVDAFRIEDLFGLPARRWYEAANRKAA